MRFAVRIRLRCCPAVTFCHGPLIAYSVITRNTPPMRTATGDVCVLATCTEALDTARLINGRIAAVRQRACRPLSPKQSQLRGRPNSSSALTSSREHDPANDASARFGGCASWPASAGRSRPIRIAGLSGGDCAAVRVGSSSRTAGKLPRLCRRRTGRAESGIALGTRGCGWFHRRASPSAADSASSVGTATKSVHPVAVGGKRKAMASTDGDASSPADVDVK